MWSKKHEKCIVCGTTRVKHAGKGMCKNCHRRKWRKINPGYDKKWQEANSEKVKESQRKWQKANPKKVKEWRERWKKNNPKYYKEYHKKNSEKIKRYAKEYKEKDPDKYRERTKRWRKENPEKFKKQRSNYWKKKSKVDIHYKLRNTVSSLIRKRLKFRLSSKKGKSTFNFLPYTLEDLIYHLEKQFTKGMNWNNYGKWHIDHKIPDCNFDYKNVEDSEFQKCWALKNLQPLWALDNMKKGGNYSNEGIKMI